MSGTNRNSFDESTEKLLTSIAQSEGFRNYKFEEGDSSVKGENYIGIVKAAKIIDNDSNKSINVVVKTASNSDALRSQASIEDLYLREIYMYETVFPTFKLLQEQKGLSTSNFTPKYYNSIKEYNSETLVLENLKDIGYKLYERRIPMNEDHISLVLSEYGRLHALSFALKDQNPDKFKKVVGSMNDCYGEIALKSGFTQNYTQRSIAAQKALDEKEHKEALEVYKRFIDTIPSFLEDILNKPVDEHSVALHGDCWTNNMMFKYENLENTAKPTHVRFLDFQISKTDSPVFDLSYFIYTCSPKEVINDVNHYLRLYYASFSDYLKQLGSDPDKLFPFTILQEHWKKYSRYGLILAPFVIYAMLTETEEAIDIAEQSDEGKNLSNAFDYEIKNFDQYKERIKPIILHFVENKFI